MTQMASTVPAADFMQLVQEHRVLLAAHGAAQQRCSRTIAGQQDRIDALEAQAMRLRAAAMLRQSTLAFALEDHAALEASIPGLPKRVHLARRVETLLARLQDLLRERLQWVQREPALPASAPTALDASSDGVGLDDLATSLRAADLVICQTGCLSHGDYWRVHDHCKRTGKACVWVSRPDALRIVRIHGPLATLRAPAATPAITQRTDP